MLKTSVLDDLSALNSRILAHNTLNCSSLLHMRSTRDCQVQKVLCSCAKRRLRASPARAAGSSIANGPVKSQVQTMSEISTLVYKVHTYNSHATLSCLGDPYHQPPFTPQPPAARPVSQHSTSVHRSLYLAPQTTAACSLQRTWHTTRTSPKPVLTRHIHAPPSVYRRVLP